MINGYFYGKTSNTAIKPKITWTAQEDVAGNYSEVTAKLSYSRTDSYMTYGQWSGSITINGDKKTVSNQYLEITKNSNTVAITHTVRVPHNEDGTKTVTISAAGAIDGTTLSKTTISGKVTLPEIPRAAAIAATDGYIGSNAMVTIGRKSEAHTYTVSYSFGNLAGYLSENGLSDTPVSIAAATLAFPLPESFYYEIPDRQAETCTLTCTTYLDGAVVGLPQQTLFTVRADPERCAPWLTVSVADENPETLALTGNQTVFVRGASNARCIITAQARYGAQITETWVGAEKTQQDTVVISGIEGESLRFMAVDSRGLFRELSVPLTMLPYVAPSLRLTASRLDATSGMGTLRVEGSFYPGDFGMQTNALRMGYRINGGTMRELSPEIDGNTFSVSQMLTDLDYTQAHQIQVTVTDALNEVSATATINPGIPLFDWGKEDVSFHVPVKYLGKTLEETFIPKSGDTMEGNLSMGDHRITQLQAPQADTDAVNKAYADSRLGMQLLWQEENPQGFSEKTVAVDLSGYQMAAIEYRFKVDSPRTKMAFGAIGSQIVLDVISQSFYEGTRVCIPYEDRVEFLAADYSAGGSTDPDNYMLPVKIYGVNGATGLTVIQNPEWLPNGGSQAWLEENGDRAQLYQMDGYVWGHIEGAGWTRSGTQFRIVSGEAEMTAENGVPYLLRKDSTGTVYAFREAGGDVGIPVYERLPESAGDGDVVALQCPVVDSVGQMTDWNKTYELSTTHTLWAWTEESVSIENNEYDPATTKFNCRINSSGNEVGYDGCILTDFIEVEYASEYPVTIGGVDQLTQSYSTIFTVDYYDSSKTKITQKASDWLGVVLTNGDGTTCKTPVTFNLFAVSGLENTKYVRLRVQLKHGTQITEEDCAGLKLIFTPKNQTGTWSRWVDTGKPNSIKYRASVTTQTVPGYRNLFEAETMATDAYLNRRINSSGVLTDADGYVSLWYLPVSVAAGETLTVRIKGIPEQTSAYSYCRLLLSENGVRSDSTTVENVQSAGWTTTAEGGGVFAYTKTIGDANNELCCVLYVKSSAITAEDIKDLVVTLNEEISETTVSICEWVEIGTYHPPVDAGWEATAETHPVMDSLHAAGSNGETGVYSGDGYLYTYISGAAWMSLSKYRQSGEGADEALSATSEKPVQNKAITAKFEEVAAAIAGNSRKIAELGGTESPQIPAFWQTAVDGCIAKIKALQVGRSCITFPFFSDNHQRNGYAGILAAHIMKACHMPYCFYGGDSISNGIIADEAEMIAQDRAFDEAMAAIPSGRFCRAVGNHDGYWYDGTNKFYYDRDGIYDLFLREEAVAQNKQFAGDGTYYYVNDLASKVRFVVLNTNGIQGSAKTFDDAQLAWLQNTALSFPESGWAAVLICHQPLSNHYHAMINNAGEVIAAIRASGAEVIGCFSGHIHRDRLFTGLAVDTETDAVGEALPFTQVTISSDHTAIAYDDATRHPIADDNKSHAIDFVTVNRGTRTVSLTRLGIGNDRQFTY